MSRKWQLALALAAVCLLFAAGHEFIYRTGNTRPIKELVQMGQTQQRVREIMGHPKAICRFPPPGVIGAASVDHWYYGPIFEAKRRSTFPYFFGLRQEIFMEGRSPGWVIGFDTNGLVNQVRGPKE